MNEDYDSFPQQEKYLRSSFYPQEQLFSLLAITNQTLWITFDNNFSNLSTELISCSTHLLSTSLLPELVLHFLFVFQHANFLVKKSTSRKIEKCLKS